MIRRAHAALFCSALAIACGCVGTVVIDGASSHSSGHGGASGHGGSPAGSGGNPVDAAGDAIHDAGADVCNPEPPPGDTAVTACFTSGFCPPAHSAPAHDQLSTALSLCNTSLYPCCGKTIIDSVACGPSTGNGECCYTVFTRINAPCTGGSTGAGSPGCLANGQYCFSPTDCCSAQCNSNARCGPMLCTVEGAPCTSNEDCCELQCAPTVPLTLCWHCIATGEPCSDAGVPCCSGACAGGGCE